MGKFEIKVIIHYSLWAKKHPVVTLMGFSASKLMSFLCVFVFLLFCFVLIFLKLEFTFNLRLFVNKMKTVSKDFS